MRTRFRNAQLVLPNEIVQVDLIIDGEKIADIDPADQTDSDRQIDCGGRYLLPGVIDDQVHFREPGGEMKEELATATRACAKGGVTTFLDMPNTNPTTTTCAALEAKLNRAKRVSLVNYGFYIGATESNLTELQRAQRTPGIKIFIGSSTGSLLVDQQEALERIFAETTLPICAHCEDETTVQRNRRALEPVQSVRDHSRIRDRQAALIATRRAIDLALRHRHRFHVLHVSTGDEIAEIAAARPYVTAEVCPHHLFFSVDDYERLGTRIQMNPSVKERSDNEALWDGLMSGAIQVVATDHAPHTLAEKNLPYPDSPSGLPAVENSLALMLNQVSLRRCDLLDVTRWMSDAPARVWDMVGKGRIAAGYDADLVLVDMELQQEIRDEDQLTKCGWSPWHGERLQGWPVQTWVMGRQVFDHGVIDGACRGCEVVYDHSAPGYWDELTK